MKQIKLLLQMIWLRNRLCSQWIYSNLIIYRPGENLAHIPENLRTTGTLYGAILERLFCSILKLSLKI